MSRIWPARLPQSIRGSRRRRAEVRVYDRLAAELENDFTVFYSSPWLGTDRLGNEKDGECDFLIAHPVLGLLAIEVKGGGITYDPTEMQWWSTDEDGIRYKIKDPVQQARSAKHELLKKLKNSRMWKERWIHTAHGVIFPGAAKVIGQLAADRPPHIFCCAHEFQSGLRAWVGQRFQEISRPPNVNPLGADGIRALERILAHPFTLNFSISAAMADSEEDFSVMEPAQFHILEEIEDLPRAEVRGAAGTGKTVVAIEDALRSARAGKRTLLSCHGKPLALDFQRRLAGVEHLTTGHFHSICLRTAKEAGIALPPEEVSSRYFGEVLPNLLVEAVSARPDLKWDRIIIDEAQDFEDAWWIAIEAALADGGSLRVFSDSNQRLYGARKIPCADLKLSPIRLSRNRRNTKTIHEAATVHYEGYKIHADGPNGLAVSWTATAGRKASIAAALKELRRLAHTEEVPMEDIALLMPDQSWLEEFRIASALSGFDFASAENLHSEDVVLDTIRRFKGLERQALIVVFDCGAADDRELAYVAFSRARFFLSVIADAGAIALLQKRDA